MRILSGDGGGRVSEVVGDDREIWRLFRDMRGEAGECLLDDLRVCREV